VRALRYAGEREVVCHDRADPRPGPTEVVLRIQAAGICGSDLHVYRHPGPDFVETGRIPGHEPAGIIEEIGSDVRGWSVGDRVTSYFRKICGTCHYCRTGHSNVCVNRGGSYGVGLGTADGADAERMAVEARLLFKVPDDFSLEEGADKLIEASGAMPAHMAIPDLLPPLGMAALVGLGNTEFKIPLGQIVHRELIVFGTSIFPTTQYEDMWRFFRRHTIAPSQVVTHRFPIEQGAEAFRLADSASTGKVCFAFDTHRSNPG
jgi:threonine dehydrogenase-like Zn-dependent dehydrogenase